MKPKKSKKINRLKSNKNVKIKIKVKILATNQYPAYMMCWYIFSFYVKQQFLFLKVLRKNDNYTN